MFDDVRADLNRCGPGLRPKLRELVTNPGLWAVLSYRFRRWVHAARVPRPVRWALRLPAVAAQLAAQVTTGIDLPASAAIGGGLYVAHAGAIVVGNRARLGRNCTITHCVTIGYGGGGRSGRTGCPVIGDRVYLGPGAIVIGPIEVGDDALVGAGAVVTRLVPPRGVVAGNPARLRGHDGSFDLIRYPGMEDDPDRRAALAERDAEPVAEEVLS